MCYQCDDPVPGEIPGDPDTVRRFAHAFQDTAQALRDAARELRNVANENITISLAIDEVRSKADEVTGDTGRVAERYQGAGDTFVAYSDALGEAQRTGNGARTAIIDNNDAGRYWRHRERDLRLLVQMGSTDPEVLEDLAEATRRANYHDTQYGIYIGRYSGAESARDEAVTAAIQGLQDAANAADLNDGFFAAFLGDLQQLWELASKYLGPVIEILRDVLEILKQIVDVLALIVSIVAIFVPFLAPLAAALTALGAILAVAIFLCSALLFLMGRETLGRVFADGISMITSVITSRLGGGTVLGNLTDGFSKTAQLFSSATRPIVIQLTSRTVAQGAAEFALEGLQSGLMSANTAPFSFVIGEGLDFQLGSSPAWGESVWDMSGSQGTDVIPGILDLPTLGSASPVAGGWELIQDAFVNGEIHDTFSAHGDSFAESWGAIGVVPAT